MENITTAFALFFLAVIAVSCFAIEIELHDLVKAGAGIITIMPGASNENTD